MKLSFLLKTFSLYFFFSFPLFAKEINGQNDTQLWIFDYVQKKISERVVIAIENEQRWGGDISTLYFSYVQSRIFFTVTDWLQVVPGFRERRSLRTREDKWISAHEPLLDIFLSTSICEWQIRDRQRAQYIIEEDRPNLWQYRHLVTLISPWKWGKMRLNPFIADEVFFRETLGFFENRFQLGARIPLGDYDFFTFYYMRRLIKNSEQWIHQNVIWLWIGYTF